jgi:hypothetical protein
MSDQGRKGATLPPVEHCPSSQPLLCTGSVYFPGQGQRCPAGPLCCLWGQPPCQQVVHLASAAPARQAPQAARGHLWRDALLPTWLGWGVLHPPFPISIPEPLTATARPASRQEWHLVQTLLPWKLPSKSNPFKQDLPWGHRGPRPGLTPDGRRHTVGTQLQSPSLHMNKFRGGSPAPRRVPWWSHGAVRPTTALGPQTES